MTPHAELFTYGLKIYRTKRTEFERLIVSSNLPCIAAFACTDCKAQGRTLDRVITTNISGQVILSQSDLYGLDVQLSRCSLLDGIMLLSKTRERDIVCNNVAPENMAAAEKRPEILGRATIRNASGAGKERLT